MTINEKLERFEEGIGYCFKDKKLFRIALTHKSYAYERNNADMTLYNERLEYLGDAILEHVISELLFLCTPIISEGDMTKKRAEIVREKSLSDAFRNINGDKYIFVGKCETTDIKDAIVADAFEALIGAIYLDGGYESVKEFVLTVLEKQISNALSGNNKMVDYKTELQELLQRKGNVNIKYRLLESSGPDHDKSFVVGVLLDNISIGKGTGKSKKQAEQKAAKVALKELKGKV